MPNVNYLKELETFITYASDEGISANERLLWYALIHIVNGIACGASFPEGFITITNKRVLSFCPFGEDALIKARNGLKQRGLLDYVPGKKNAAAPLYKLAYFTANTEGYPFSAGRVGGKTEGKFIDPENDSDFYPFLTGKTGGKTEGKTEGKTWGKDEGKPEGKHGGFILNVNNTDNVIQTNYTHIQTNARAQETCETAMYRRLDGVVDVRRYDGAYLTSAKARSAVAQRIIDKCPSFFRDGNHEFICELLKNGVKPEIIEDVGMNESNEYTASNILASLKIATDDNVPLFTTVEQYKLIKDGSIPSHEECSRLEF